MINSMAAPAPVFFFGAMSPYSWFAAERIERLLPQARWHGLFLGGMFKANGRVSWGLTEERAKGIADCDERAGAHGLGPIRWPDPWPTVDLHVARAMVYADARQVLKPFALSAMRLAFLEGEDIGSLATVLEAGRRVGIDSSELEGALQDPAVKQGLREANDQAIAMGVFGVPTVIVDGEIFWGDDRLRDATDAYRSVAGT
jgi:2-hydroxychromene-2-carboxylate isomerase